MFEKTFGEKIENQKYIERKGVYGIFQNRNDEIGVVKVRDTHFLVGGGIDLGENHIEALKREFIEEIGFTIENILFLDKFSEYHFSIKDKNYYKLVGNIYQVTLKEKICEGIETDHNLIWIKKCDIEQSMRLQYQSYILRLAYDSTKYTSLNTTSAQGSTARSTDEDTTSIIITLLLWTTLISLTESHRLIRRS
jgi:8-oxo-dGTP diphosphatase